MEEVEHMSAFEFFLVLVGTCTATGWLFRLVDALEGKR